MRVLLVDDDATQLRKYRNIIADLSHDVEAISESVVAWNLLDAEEFDAIVSDVQMPLFSGVELVQKIHYLKLEVPTLLHSSEPRYSTGHEWIELTELPEFFPYVAFHLKHFNVEPPYIKDFLEKVENELGAQ